jgi:hypothetical protein
MHPHLDFASEFAALKPSLRADDGSIEGPR